MVYKNAPSETIDRLFLYLRALTCLEREGKETVSSSRLADMCHVKAANVRKDLSYFGEFGTRGVGYDVIQLKNDLRRILSFDNTVDVALVGVGNIGKALLTHSDFNLEGFNISMAFDNDPAKIGTSIGSVVIEKLEELPRRIKSEGIDLAVLAVPDDQAPAIGKLLAEAGITSILSFSPCELCMPDNIKVTCVDLSMEMARLLYHSRIKHLASDERMEG